MFDRTKPHPYLDIFVASLVPRLHHGPEHDKDPPAPHVVPLPAGSPEAQRLLDLLLGADHDFRGDHARAGAVNLDLAETHLRLRISRDGLTPPLEAARAGIARAQAEAAAGHTARALAALADAVRALVPAQPSSMASTRSG
ncbi:hypothetical protein JMJ55_20650 [Belnapia sp. T6]|uniref:Uncharacterized protein n=1 Tax=Belnapia mucosa TaxID=2804532 RepID=A0ABS1V7V2_9PROT|nr:hypothetical protein [Belnapia mucosa]MBL6457751.1 hypothetical protein [Belnapia mucosa]